MTIMTRAGSAMLTTKTNINESQISFIVRCIKSPVCPGHGRLTKMPPKLGTLARKVKDHLKHVDKL